MNLDRMVRRLVESSLENAPAGMEVKAASTAIGDDNLFAVPIRALWERS